MNVERIEVNGNTWYFLEIDAEDGNLVAVNLYDANSNLVAEFPDYEEMMHFVSGVEKI